MFRKTGISQTPWIRTRDLCMLNCLDGIGFFSAYGKIKCRMRDGVARVVRNEMKCEFVAVAGSVGGVKVADCRRGRNSQGGGRRGWCLPWSAFKATLFGPVFAGNCCTQSAPAKTMAAAPANRALPGASPASLSNPSPMRQDGGGCEGRAADLRGQSAGYAANRSR